LGIALHDRFICQRWHTPELFQYMGEKALRHALMHLDAHRIAHGLKPISEIYADD